VRQLPPHQDLSGISIRAGISVLLGGAIVCAAGTAGLKHEQSIYTSGKQTLEGPEGVACAEDGRVVLSDTGHGRLLAGTWSDGRFSNGKEMRLPQLPAPGRVQLDAAGNIFVLDGKLRKIARLDPSGAFLGYLGIEGAPISFKVSGRKVYVLDGAGRRVLRLEEGAQVSREIALPKEGSFTDIAVLTSGRLYAVDAVTATLWFADDPDRSFRPLAPGARREMSFPTYVASDGRGSLWVVDRHASAIVVLGEDGGFLTRALRYGRADGLLNYPGQLCLTARHLFIADRNNNRVQVFAILR
jgi:hypothetical protein